MNLGGPAQHVMRDVIATDIRTAAHVAIDEVLELDWSYYFPTH